MIFGQFSLGHNNWNVSIQAIGNSTYSNSACSNLEDVLPSYEYANVTRFS